MNPMQDASREKEGNMAGRRAIGLDIGTSSIRAVVMESRTGSLLETLSSKNDTSIGGRPVWERAQNAARIYEKARCLVDDLLPRAGGKQVD